MGAPRGNRVGQMVCLQGPASDLSGTHCHAHMSDSAIVWLGMVVCSRSSGSPTSR